ncbi:vitamin K epoxide reductase family protein [Neorhodopirellula pilleata]|uniref:Vitamin K epoxide reductase family protein n=1 Tax=Neorhodopirellula pilleata TaxID=2714738 RepID=A0A5C6AHN5_9BACT|nr:vitamin K epoxide reductase family protein [Neorhodopirellula pilleata]TWT98768.1 Vitamin K epoxide reductase family protein [Neorhodopirellula pilleata]
MNHTTTPTLLARHQGEVLSKSSASSALNWLVQDMKSLPRWPVTTLLATCISVAIGTSSYLLWTHLTSSPIAGCGSGDGWIDCEGVARSRWSVWFGVPVSLLALAIYVAMAASLVVASLDRFSRPRREIAWIGMTAAVFAAGMSAIWFIVVQLLVLQHICLYCMLAHTCGLVATITLLVAGPLRAKSAMTIASLSFVGLMILVSGQLLTPPPAAFEIELFDTPSVDGNDALEFLPPNSRNENLEDNLFDAPVTSAKIYKPPQGYAHLLALPVLVAIGVVEAESSQADDLPERFASIQGGAIKLKVADWPHIGPNDAKYVVVEMFDYCCPPCRETFQAVRSAQVELGDDLAIVLLPVPLNSDCNPTIKVTGAHYKESCVLSKLAVATWRVDPKAFESLHLWMLADDHAPTYAETIAKARTLVDPKRLDIELASGVSDQYISRHVALYKRVGEGAIPKLMFPRTSVVGKFTSVDGLVDLIRREGTER